MKKIAEASKSAFMLKLILNYLTRLKLIPDKPSHAVMWAINRAYRAERYVHYTAEYYGHEFLHTVAGGRYFKDNLTYLDDRAISVLSGLVGSDAMWVINSLTEMRTELIKLTFDLDLSKQGLRDQTEVHELSNRSKDLLHALDREDLRNKLNQYRLVELLKCIKRFLDHYAEDKLIDRGVSIKYFEPGQSRFSVGRRIVDSVEKARSQLLDKIDPSKVCKLTVMIIAESEQPEAVDAD